MIRSNKHPVNFKKGLNVVTGKSSTGKSALIEIFDYCFGSGENTIPKGVITTSAAIYYVAFSVNEQSIVIARDPDKASKAFFVLLSRSILTILLAIILTVAIFAR
ncbi:hypothetical protein LFREDSHE_24850 [Shewanella baltica]